MRKVLDIERNKKFLIPDLLPEDENYTGAWKNTLRFEYRYENYLKSIFTRFLVTMYPYVFQQTYWRNGVVLEHEGNKALVKVDVSQKKLEISVDNAPHTRRIFLAIIRKEFAAIHQSFASLTINEMAAHPSNSAALQDYKTLCNMEADGETEVYVNEFRGKVPLTEFLDGVESLEERRERNRDLPRTIAPAKRERFALLQKTKAAYDSEAEKYGNRFSKTFACLTSLIHAAFVIFLIYKIFLDPTQGWNNYEKWTFTVFALLEVFNVLFSVIFFIRTAKDYSWAAFRDTLIEKRRATLYVRYSFDKTEYDNLCQEVSR